MRDDIVQSPPSSSVGVRFKDLVLQDDWTIEAAFNAIRQKPWLALLMPWWLLIGRSRLQGELSGFKPKDSGQFRCKESVISDIGESRRRGIKVWLIADESERPNALQIVEAMPIFEGVVHPGECGGMQLLSATRGTSRTLKQWIRAIRLHQWCKNLLVFVPLVTAHRVGDLSAWMPALACFIAFGLCASGTYLLNDLFDLESDRRHLRKRHRPFASGQLSARAGLLAAFAMLVASGLIAVLLPPGFRAALLLYLVTTVTYSIWLKRTASIDVIALAALYTLRVVGGAWAIGVPLSFWLLAFSMFIFLSLAVAKRVAELVDLQKRTDSASGAIAAQVHGRGYAVADINVLTTLGCASGYLAVLVLALYINSPEVIQLYSKPQILWLVAPLMLLWITRLWVVTSRGWMNEDPVVFAVKDPETWATGVLVGILLVTASRA